MRPFIAGAATATPSRSTAPCRACCRPASRSRPSTRSSAASADAVPFKGPFAIGHECVAQVLAVGATCGRPRRPDGRRAVGRVVRHLRAVPARPDLQVRHDDSRTLAAYGFGPASGSWGGMVADALRVPFADHMLVAVPAGVPPLRVAAAGDNLADAWRSVVTPLRERPGGSVLVIGGGAKSIGLYAAGLAAAHGAARRALPRRRPGAPRDRRGVRRADAPARRTLAPAHGPLRRRRRGVLARRGPAPRDPRRWPRRRLHRGRLLPRRPGRACRSCTCTPPTRRSASASHTRAPSSPSCSRSSPAAASRRAVTTLTADWDDAPTAYAAQTTKVVLQRDAGG